MTVSTQPFNRSVLIVDDEPRLRDMLCRAVTELGYTPAAVRSAEQAMREIAGQLPAVILLDINLPGMDGMEFLEELRRITTTTQVIILTGFGSLEAAKTAIHHDVVDFLTKPCSLDDLERALSRAEQRRRQLIHPPVIEEPPLPAPAAAAATFGSSDDDAPATLEEVEHAHILAVLARNNNNRAATAAALGISERTLYYRLARYQAESQ